MNRIDEYRTLMHELNDTPTKLEDSRQRVEQKLKAEVRHRYIILPITSTVVFLTLFTLMVNCFPTFAYACGRIPLIKELAKVVAFSPSLSAAVENKYVQSIEQEQTKNDITARIEYAIVDQKQVNIFYSLDSGIYKKMDATPEIKAIDGSNLEGYSISSGNSDTPNGEMNFMTVDFTDEDMPGSMLFTLKVHDNEHLVQDEAVLWEDYMLSEEDNKAPDYISEFTFELKFEPYYNAQGEEFKLNQQFELSGQKLILETAQIYPTHIRMNLADVYENTAWPKSLDFYLKNEKGMRFDSITNGISATGSVDSPMMKSYRLESSFFSNSKHLTLYITGVTWLDKDMEKIKLDLVNATAQRLPQGVTFEKAERSGDSWLLTFSAKQYEGTAAYQLFTTEYYDEEGEKYEYNKWSTDVVGHIDEQTGKRVNIQEVQIPLVNYPYDTVYLCPDFSTKEVLVKPVAIKIK